jgi:hypothetical protein
VKRMMGNWMMLIYWICCSQDAGRLEDSAEGISDETVVTIRRYTPHIFQVEHARDRFST